DQRLDHRLVGIALLAFVVDDTFSREARRGLGEGAVFVDGVWNVCLDVAFLQISGVFRPDFEVFPTMSRSSVDKSGARIVRDVIAVEHRHVKAIHAMKASKRMSQD